MLHYRAGAARGPALQGTSGHALHVRAPAPAGTPPASPLPGAHMSSPRIGVDFLRSIIKVVLSSRIVFRAAQEVVRCGGFRLGAEGLRVAHTRVPADSAITAQAQALPSRRDNLNNHGGEAVCQAEFRGHGCILFSGPRDAWGPRSLFAGGGAGPANQPRPHPKSQSPPGNHAARPLWSNISGPQAPRNCVFIIACVLCGRQA